MPMLISHRTSAYVDVAEMERAAGALEIASKRHAENRENYQSAVLHGASAALYALCSTDIRTKDDFLAVIEPFAFGD